jgi:octaprenyl-diphosphate synthase
MLAADSKPVSAPKSETLHSGPACSWKRIIEPVEPFLDAVSQRLSQEVQTFDPEVVPFADYALNGQGKQLRPALVALCSDALGGTKPDHVSVAAIIEMVHLATLVHDDVMDEAEIRRGRLTMAANWGNSISILFGDCLFAHALELAARFPTPEVCRAVAAATKRVCSGEVVQSQLRGDFGLTREKYFKIIEMKTAELFALSCDLSALLSGASMEKRSALRNFGLSLGIAYQIYDDCLDLFGSEVAAGKSLGTDLAQGKLTLPVLLACERATTAERARIKALVGHWKANSMPVMSELLAKYDALAASIGIMTHYLDRARELLLELPPSNGQAGLLGLTDFLARQTEALACSRSPHP